MRNPLTVLWLCLALALGACMGRPESVVAPSSKAIHTVTAGQNVYKVAQLHFVSTRDIITLNNLSAPYFLRVGQRLRIPQLRIHTIVANDTLDGIARQYNVSLFSLARLNRLRPPYTIYQGKKLRIPSSQHEEKTLAAPAKTPKPEKPSKRMKIQKNQNIAMIKPPRRRQGILRSTTEKKARAKSTSQTTQKNETQTARTPDEQWLWPLRGKVISPFGHKTQGFRNDGINIRAKIGSAVRAARRGTVVYAGDKLSGFGWILILRHDNGFMTAYAHNQTLLVERGDKVERGQVIARSGVSGGVQNGQLHFELRKNGKPVDPLLHLKS